MSNVVVWQRAPRFYGNGERYKEVDLLDALMDEDKGADYPKNRTSIRVCKLLVKLVEKGVLTLEEAIEVAELEGWVFISNPEVSDEHGC